MAAEKYRVTAPTKVFGVEPGKTFTREIPEPQRSQLLNGGAIEKVGRAPATQEAKSDEGKADTNEVRESEGIPHLAATDIEPSGSKE